MTQQICEMDQSIQAGEKLSGKASTNRHRQATITVLETFSNQIDCRSGKESTPANQQASIWTVIG